MSEMTTEPSAVTKVARNLSAIEDMTAQLLTQAIHKANDREMPGGDAMTALAHVASLTDWERRIEVTEAVWWESPETTHEDRPDWLGSDEDDTWEPPLQTLLFWSEQWRDVHGYDLDRRPTIASEAGFIRWALNWAWENEPHFEDFAREMEAVQRRMENMLYAGVRVERGAPCLYDECKGRRIVRHVDDNGERTDWRCSSCKREWDEDRYAQMVTAAHEAAKFEEVAGDMWCSVDYASRDTGRSPKTIRTWINRGELSTACVIAGRRTKFVKLDEVRKRHEQAELRRKGAA
jgi:hypothetical protein